MREKPKTQETKVAHEKTFSCEVPSPLPLDLNNPSTLRDIIDQFNEGLVKLDDQNQIIYANEQALNIFQCSFLTLMHSSLQDYFQDPIDYSENKTQHTILMDGSPAKLRFFRNNLSKFILVEKVESVQQAKEINYKTREYVSFISHEVRTPLTSIKAFADILLYDSQLGRAQQEEYLGIIAQETNKAVALLSSILDLTKLEMGQMDWHKLELRMDQLVSRSLSGFKAKLEKQKKRVVYSVEDNLPTVIGDNMRLMQVIDNLISNAIKFVPETGEIKIYLYKCKDQVVLKVQDNGVGIPEEDKAKIFQKFQQANNQQHSEHRGAGLGLAISREIILHHHGRIWFESTTGQGSAFYISLPATN